MKKSGLVFKKNKKAVIYDEVIFLVLNLVFFSVLLIFIVSSVNGIPLYEQAYAKEIALMISSSKPDTIIYLNMEETLKRFDIENPLDIVEINNKENQVIVSFSASRGRYFKYFTDADVSLDSSRNLLIINITEIQK